MAAWKLLTFPGLLSAIFKILRTPTSDPDLMVIEPRLHLGHQVLN